MVEYVRLGDVCDVRDGTHESPKYIEKGYPLITSKNITSGYIELKNVNYISEEDFININKRSNVDDGDILMPMIGTIGKPIIVNKKYEFAIKNVALIKFNNKNICNKYIFYLLNSKYFYSYIQNNNRGGNQKFISLGNIRNMPIPICSISEQQHIVKTLDTASAVIQKRKKQIALLDDLAKSVFIEMFGDPIENPKGWDIGTIRDVVSDVRYGTSKPSIENGRYVYLRMNNITYEGRLDLSDLKYIDVPENEIEKYVVRKGDVLFNRTNSKELVGKTCVFTNDEEMIIAGYIIIIRTSEKSNSMYLSSFLNSKQIKTLLSSMCKSIIGQANINAQELQDIKIIIPPIKLQKEFADRIEKIERQRILLELGLKKIEEAYGALMQKYFG